MKCPKCGWKGELRNCAKFWGCYYCPCCNYYLANRKGENK